jgi:molecular chaperone HscB
MTPEPIPVHHVSSLECRSCGAGTPVDEHFCPQCSRILALGRHGDYFSFLGLPRTLGVDAADLERRFRDLSRRFHPDFYYNASPTERLASLERSSYLNDAYRTLRNRISRIEHLLAIEGVSSSAATGGGTTPVPAGLLEEVFALNEELDEIRQARESGDDPERLRARVQAARRPIDAKRVAHERELDELCARWDGLLDSGTPEERRATLQALRDRLLERNYLTNLLATIDRESAAMNSDQGADTADRRP